MAAQWQAQQPAGWNALQEDPRAVPYYEAYPGAPMPDAYYPAAPTPGTLAANEYRKKRSDDYGVDSCSLILLRVGAIGIMLLVCGLVAFVMVAGIGWIKSSDADTTTESTTTTFSTGQSFVIQIRHRASESLPTVVGTEPRTEPRTEPTEDSREIYSEEPIAVLGNKTLSFHGNKKAVYRDEVLPNVPLKRAPRRPRKLHRNAATARRNRTSTTLE
ncbi:uncharacterized protein LOC125943677 [Dermacentor silvarum]|uniref:uncharacterized protein LOC125943677 n=1 Tax=Dermacentor silvarum TaxID=543639 RepID=UPI002100CD0E|nr:uncharacterized protein LOC125943677 [Dermacentor silvarum]